MCMLSSLMMNCTSAQPTIFCILKSRNLAGKPSFCMIRAYLRAASLDSSSLLAPVHTILPEEKMRAVVRGALMRMINAANRFGLYSELRACNAITFKSSLQPTLIVLTTFLTSIHLMNLSETISIFETYCMIGMMLSVLE